MYIHQRVKKEGYIYVLDKLVLIFLQLRMSLISVFSLVLDIPVPTTCAELFDVSSILLFFPDRGSVAALVCPEEEKLEKHWGILGLIYVPGDSKICGTV